MYKLLRATAAIIGVVLIATAIPACQSSNTDVNKTPAEEVNTTAETVEIKIPVYERGISGEPTVDNNYWTKWIQDNALKAVNVKVTYVPIPRTKDIETLNTMLASKDAPDLIFTKDYAAAYSFYSRGLLQEIPQATLEKYGKDLQSYIGKDILKYGAIDGKQYFITAKKPLNGGFSASIRKDWLDKLGLKVPASTDELYTTLKAFKEKDPGSLGTGNVVPMGIDSITGNSAWFSDYGFRPDNVSEEEFAMYSDNTLPALSWGPDKDALKFFNKLYSEGLISQNFDLDVDGKILKSGISNGKVGVFYSPVLKNSQVLDSLLQNVPTARLAPVAALQAHGKKINGYSDYPFGMLSGISKSSKNPEAIIKFLNWMSQKDVLFTLQNGFENINYETKYGLPVPKEDYNGNEKLILGTNKDYYSLVSDDKDISDVDKNIRLKAELEAPAGYLEYYIENYKFTLSNMKTQNFLFNQEILSADKYKKSLEDKWEEAATKLITSKPSEFEALYEKYSKEYLASGYQDVLDEKKRVYQSMKKK